ncbi:hypothetical protein ACUXTG_001303 [Staphylococcus capitis]
MDKEKISIATSLPCSDARILGFLSSNPKALYAKSCTILVSVSLNRCTASSNTDCVAVEPVGLLGYVK